MNDEVNRRINTILAEARLMENERKLYGVDLDTVTAWAAEMRRLIERLEECPTIIEAGG